MKTTGESSCSYQMAVIGLSLLVQTNPYVGQVAFSFERLTRDLMCKCSTQHSKILLREMGMDGVVGDCIHCRYLYILYVYIDIYSILYIYIYMYVSIISI